MTYRGDFNTSAIVRFMWNSFAVAGESITRATNGTISVYKDGGTTQTTTGVTDTEDFDGLTGVHYVAIDTSADGTFYSAGSDFAVIVSAATIDGKTINAVLAEFSILNRSGLRPTVAGRTLDVTATGAAGIDLANVENQGSTLALSATTVGVVTTVNGLAAGAITAAAIATDAGAEIADAVWDEATSGHATSGSTGAALTAAGASGDPLTNAVPGSYAGGTAGYILGSLNGVTPTVVDPLNASTGVLTLTYGNVYNSTTTLGRLRVPNTITGLDLTSGTVTSIKLNFKLERDRNDTDTTPTYSLTAHAGSLIATRAEFALTSAVWQALKSGRVYAWSATCLENGDLVTFNSGSTGAIDWSVNPAS